MTNAIYTPRGAVATATIEVWAIPHSRYHMEENPGTHPFEYRLYAGTDPWNSGAVKVCEFELSRDVPVGINLLQSAIETLEKEKANAYKEYLLACQRLDDQISQLRLLAAPANSASDPDAIDGKLV